jgi:hypothetical protein
MKSEPFAAGDEADGDSDGDAGIFAFVSTNSSTPSDEREVEFGSRDASPCSPNCRQPVRVIFAWAPSPI